jgi:hypothetical protein
MRIFAAYFNRINMNEETLPNGRVWRPLDQSGVFVEPYKSWNADKAAAYINSVNPTLDALGFDRKLNKLTRILTFSTDRVLWDGLARQWSAARGTVWAWQSGCSTCLPEDTEKLCRSAVSIIAYLNEALNASNNEAQPISQPLASAQPKPSKKGKDAGGTTRAPFS